MKKYLGFDIATYNTGWCIATVKNNQVTNLEKGTIAISKGLSLPKRLATFQDTLKQFITKTNLELILFKEQPIHGQTNLKISGSMFKAHGVFEAMFCDFEINDLSPSFVKKTITGKGNATKVEVQRALRKYDLPSLNFKNDDESDAIAIALSGLLKKNLVNIKVV